MSAERLEKKIFMRSEAKALDIRVKFKEGVNFTNIL
jgi:hypothetical protein